MTRYYAYIKVPDGSLQHQVLQYEREFQGVTSRSVPHITIWSPRVLLSPYSERDLKAVIAESVRGHGQFQVSTTAVGHFNRKWNVHYCIDLTTELSELARKIKKCAVSISEPSTSYIAPRFHPHITLAQGIDSDQGKVLHKRARLEYVSHHFLCTEIFLMRIREGEVRWATVASFPL